MRYQSRCVFTYAMWAKSNHSLETVITFANGATFKFGFNICEVKKRRILVEKQSIDLHRKNAEYFLSTTIRRLC